MNKYGLAVIVTVVGALVIAVLIGLKYSQPTLLFGLVAALSAPVVFHKMPSIGWTVGMLVGLSSFAIFPLKKLYQIDGFIHEMPVNQSYAAILWVIGFGWKTSWR